MKFGVQICQGGMTFHQFRDVWLECEKLGFDSVWAYDHHNNCLEGWTLISTMASLSKHIRFGLLVACNSYRHPPLLAKMAATLDILSDGRLEFGIGAGDAQKEYESYGWVYPDNATRIRQLDEALCVTKKMWTEDKPTYKGKYFSIKEVRNEPKPLQKPYPPIWIGSLTGKRMISRVAAIHANVFNIFPGSPSEFVKQMKAFRETCRLVGRRYEDVEKTITKGFLMARTKSDLDSKLSQEAKKRGVALDEYKKGLEGSLYGTPSMCAETVKQYADVGVQGLILIFPPSMQIEDLRLFSEVIQQFR
jgi:alkanesulfonate monooxygenase SsuD/methylene tetrahydromethanopterin reductase-like flavin-dependent oxidoreductase (luciferase family)